MMYEKLERLMSERGVKPAEISRQTGVTTQALSAWKKGDYTPKADKIQTSYTSLFCVCISIKWV